MLQKERTMSQQKKSWKEMTHLLPIEADQEEDGVGDASHMPNHGMMQRERTMSQQNFLLGDDLGDAGPVPNHGMLQKERTIISAKFRARG
jgi:hypothetical protein